MNVFLSYAQPDQKWSERLAHELEAEGVDCWLDSNAASSGKDWESQVRHALDDANVCLVVLSSASRPSVPKLSKEWSAMQESAWQRKDLALCTLKIADVDPPPFLKPWQSLDVSSELTNWKRIVESTKKLLVDAQSTGSILEEKQASKERLERFGEIQALITARRQEQGKPGDQSPW